MESKLTVMELGYVYNSLVVDGELFPLPQVSIGLLAAR